MRAYVGMLGGRMRQYLVALREDADASYRAQILAAVRQAAPSSVLDLGCHDGEWTLALGSAAGAPERLAGLELVEEARALALGRGIEAVGASLNEPLPFADGQFDLVHANQVIEHLADLDLFVSEVRRVLVPGGVAVVCTENLASWHNIAALVAGLMPFSLTNISTQGPIGNPFGLLDADPSEVPVSWFHTRVLTTVGLRHLFELHGLRVERTIASGYYPAPRSLAREIAPRDVRHAAFVGVVARRV
jgi:SAM-dependent methyltransferase